MSVLARASSLEWEAFGNEELYHPLRDGPRQQKRKCVVDTMRAVLAEEQVLAASRAQTLWAKAEGTFAKVNGFDRVDQTRNHAERALHTKLDAIRELRAMEQVCPNPGAFRAICQFATLSETARAAGTITEKGFVNDRVTRRVVSDTLEALARFLESASPAPSARP